MKIAVTGSTGFIGKRLIYFIREKGWQAVSVTREDFSNDTLAENLNGCDIVVNLAGAPIVGRWTKSYKKEIWDSRVDVTEKLVDAMEELDQKPECLISASAVGIYKDGMKQTVDNPTYNEGWLTELCREWECKAGKYSGRTVILRLGVVLGKHGGLIKRIREPFMKGLGGKIGDGKQGFSWIHLEDLVNLIIFFAENRSAAGEYNATSPSPVSNIRFTKTLGKVINRPVILPVPSMVLKGLFGEGSKIMSEGQLVYPEKVEKMGFVYKYPDLFDALNDIFK